MTLTLGIGRSFVRSVGTGVAHGPTVQIARSPTSIALSSGSPTANITFTALDANGVATGARVYGVSSDPTVTTILPDAPWTATKVGTGTTAVLYGQLVDPGAEPFYTAAAGQTLILRDDFSRAAADSTADMMSEVTTTQRIVPIQKITGGSLDASTSVITPGLNGKTRAIRMSYTGIGSSPTFVSYPDNTGTGYPATLPAAGKTHIAQFYARTNGGAGDNNQFKFFMFWQPDAQGTHTQFSLSVDSAGYVGLVGPSLWEMVDASTTGRQAKGPFYENLKGSEFRFTAKYRSHTANTGTVDMLIQTANIAFDGVVALTNGDRIRIVAKGGAFVGLADNQSMSAAEFVVSAFVSNPGDGLSRATITRASGSTGAASQRVAVVNNTVVSGLFSTSQSGEPTVANNAYVGLQNFDPYQISAFDGTTGCTLVKQISDLIRPALAYDRIGQVYSTILDGYCQVFVNGGKIVHVARSKAGVTDEGALGAWTSMLDVACLQTHVGFGSIEFGRTATSAPTFDYDVGDITWWTED